MSDEIDKAFNYEHGQYICHIYASIPEEDLYLLESFIEIVSAKQKLGQAWSPWGRPIRANDPTDDPERGNRFDEKPHITLLRGHRAIHYHQIRSMVEKLHLECAPLQPVRLLLDRLTIFSNAEKTKQFLCLASTRTATTVHSTQTNALLDLKRTISSVVSQYGVKLTDEDETGDTVAHCSLMTKDYEDGPECESNCLKDIEEIIDANLDEYPSCLLNIKTIHIKIGKKIYDIQLGN